MSQFPHDDFAKDWLGSLTEELGKTKPSLEMAGEKRQIDFYFEPNKPLGDRSGLGLLGRLLTTPIAFEPFRNPVDANKINSCIGKRIDLPPENNVYLWILTPTLFDTILQGFGAVLNTELCESGLYQLPPLLRTGIVVIYRLPKVLDTLWLRMLGRDRVQGNAAAEVAAMPPDYPYRDKALELFANLKVMLELKKNKIPEETELLMNLSPLYLEQIDRAKQEGQKILLQNILTDRLAIVRTDLERHRTVLEELFVVGMGFNQSLVKV
jgi:hypothetical protein